MEVELRPDNPAITFEEFSMERSKSFVKALQELKNLRPQLYLVAKYCKKSFLHTELKQMVLDNLKDYAVQALVNAVDHLGTVAYQLADLLEQQTLEVSNLELKASCLNQQLLICQTYTDKEGLRQQQMLAFIPRHHKHYILPNTPASKTLSWHLASETKSTLKGTSQTLASNEISNPPGNASEVFQLLENEDNTNKKSSAAGSPASIAFVQTLGIIHRELEGSKPLTAFRFRSFDNQKREIIRTPVGSKIVLSAFFVKQKVKLKAGYIA